MEQYMVIVDKLNKRSVVPANLPDSVNIVGVVNRGFVFGGQEVAPAEVPNSALGKWYKGADGYFYWGGGLAPVVAAANEQPVPAGHGLLTAEQVKGGTGASLSTAQKFLPYLVGTCTQYAIDTPVRRLCFLAQVGHESAGLFYTEELASGADYENRKDLGNTEAGDGVRYKGRGLIQLTGRGNYQSLSNELQEDFIKNPGLLGGKNAALCSPQQLKYAALSAGWYWNNHALNAVADLINIELPVDEGDNLENFRLLTRKINGGYNGINDRLARYIAGLPFFKA